MTRNKQFQQHYENAEMAERPAPLPLRRETQSSLPYPVKALGKVLGDAVLAITDKVQCPDAIAAQSVLGAAALAAQAHADVIHPALGDKHPLSLFLVTIAASGDRKSSADKVALDPVHLREADLYDQYKRDIQSYSDAKDRYDRSRDRLLKKADDSEFNDQMSALIPPIAPRGPLLTVQEPTLEGLHKLMVDGQPSLGLFSDEGGRFLGGHGMSEDAKLRTIAGLSELWDATNIKRVRGGDGWSFLRGRRLSLHLMIQPGIAAEFLSNKMFADQGILSRMLVTAPASLAGTRMQREPKAATDAALKRYRDRLLKLLRHKPCFADFDKSELKPRALLVATNAKLVWRNFADECEAALAEGQKYEPIRGFANKLAEQALRIAAVLELVDDINVEQVNSPSMKRGIEIARYYASEALRLFEQGTCSAEILQAEKVLKWLHKERKSVIALPTIYQNGPNSVREAAKAREAVNMLVSHGWLYAISGGAKIDGVYRREAWEVVTG